MENTSFVWNENKTKSIRFSTIKEFMVCPSHDNYDKFRVLAWTSKEVYIVLKDNITKEEGTYLIDIILMNNAKE